MRATADMAEVFPAAGSAAEPATPATAAGTSASFEVCSSSAGSTVSAASASRPLASARNAIARTACPASSTQHGRPSRSVSRRSRRSRAAPAAPAELAAPHLEQVVARDLTDRVRDERERTRLTEQLARAHRLETVGQLAGGLAHDLNNLLTVLVTTNGGTTTLQMCPHLDGLGLQVLTNSLHIVHALLQQPDTKVLVPSGSVFREQNIILAPSGEDSMPQFHGPKLFMGAAAVGAQGIMQQDVILVAAERRLIERADQVIR